MATDPQPFKGTPDAPHVLGALPDPPPWRSLPQATGVKARKTPASPNPPDPRARRFSTPAEIAVVNAAILLRRPLLIEGDPGSGKSSLAYAIAHELQLGPVIRWEVRSRTTVQDGLYQYDAIARLHAAQIAKMKQGAGKGSKFEPPLADEYLTLGPLGTALYPHDRPRVLLVDELDKGELDLPSDLLHALEEGAFPIPELEREEGTSHEVRLIDGGDERFGVDAGKVQCGPHFPIIVITTNKERDFPPAFHRRCLRLEVEVPKTQEGLRSILQLHDQAGTEFDQEVAGFLDRVKDGNLLGVDQLMNQVFLAAALAGKGSDDDLKAVREAVLRSLDPQ